MRSASTQPIALASPIIKAELKLTDAPLPGTMKFNDTQTAYCKTHTRPEVSIKVQKLVTLSAIAYDHVSAQYNLGSMYNQGLGVDKNFTKAAEWIEKAALEGDINAQYALGNFYILGRGVDQNISEAFEWYLKAALQGHAVAQFNLGEMYDQGVGVDQNSREAFGWHIKAAQQGYKEAQFNVGVKGASLRCRSTLFVGDRWVVGWGETDRITMRVEPTNVSALELDVLTVFVDVLHGVWLDMGNMALPLSLEINHLSSYTFRLVP